MKTDTFNRCRLPGSFKYPNLYIVIVQLLVHESGDPEGAPVPGILPAILMMIL
jgi:hypothetical protein